MSGPEPDASARGTTFTRLLKSLKTMSIFTFGYCFSKFAESSFSTGSRPGSWLSYDQMVRCTGPSLSKPEVVTAPDCFAPPEPGDEPGVPPHPAAAIMVAIAATIARCFLARCRFIYPPVGWARPADSTKRSGGWTGCSGTIARRERRGLLAVAAPDLRPADGDPWRGCHPPHLGRCGG